MTEFDPSHILEQEESLGTLLRDAREAKGLSLQELHQATKIKEIHLEAMEENRFEEIADAVYARGFLRICGNALDLDSKELVDQYNRFYGLGKPEKVRQNPKLSEKKKPKKIKWIVGGVMALVLISSFSLFVTQDQNEEKIVSEQQEPVQAESLE